MKIFFIISLNHFKFLNPKLKNKPGTVIFGKNSNIKTSAAPHLFYSYGLVMLGSQPTATT